MIEFDRSKDHSANAAADRSELRAGAARETDASRSTHEKRSDHPCFQCVQCCAYVAIEIDAPTTMKEYDYIVWYLYHRDISVFVDWEGDWFVKFEARCEHLTSGGLCDIYASRPAICKDFDWRECENRERSEPADKWLFENAEQFLRWFEDRRPKTFQRFQEHMRQKHSGGEERELGRLKVTQLLSISKGE